MTRPRTRRLAPLVALLAAGCIQLGPGEDAPEIRRHALDAAEVPDAGEPGALPSLAVRGFTARGRYDLRVVRREVSGQVRLQEFERWLEAPSDALTTVVRENLARSRAFASVSAAEAGFEAALVLEGSVLAFDVVDAQDGARSARLALRLDLAEARGGRLVHSATWTAERPLPDGDEAHLGPVMSACVADVVARAVPAWRDALSGAR